MFTKGEEVLHEATKDVIFKCHKYLRDAFGPSVVSLREISTFSKIVKFFLNYFSIKRNCNEKEDSNDDEDKKLGDQNSVTNLNNKNNSGLEKFDKITSIICSVYLCYYIRLIGKKKRGEFNNQLRGPLIKLVNSFKND